MSKFDALWKIETCEICGQEFIPTYKYVYKIKGKRGKIKYYCSYTCWRKAGGDNGKRGGWVRRKEIL